MVIIKLTQDFDDKNNDHTFDLELIEQILEFLNYSPKSTILNISNTRCAMFFHKLKPH